MSVVGKILQLVLIAGIAALSMASVWYRSGGANRKKRTVQVGRSMERHILLIGFWLAAINLAIGAVIRIWFSGDASLGYVLNGHHYFGIPDRYTEVSAELWEFSWWQIPTMFVTQPVGIICALALWPPKWLRNSN
jgi:hypothetical protein